MKFAGPASSKGTPARLLEMIRYLRRPEMDLLKQAEARAIELRAQGLSERADRLENAVKMSRGQLQPISSRSERVSLENNGCFSFEVRLVFHEGGHLDRCRWLRQ